MRKLTDADAGNLYAMKVLKKATLKGEHISLFFLLRWLGFLFSIYFIFSFCGSVVLSLLDVRIRSLREEVKCTIFDIKDNCET